jgi:hypothetical protein
LLDTAGSEEQPEDASPKPTQVRATQPKRQKKQKQPASRKQPRHVIDPRASNASTAAESFNASLLVTVATGQRPMVDGLLPAHPLQQVNVSVNRTQRAPHGSSVLTNATHTALLVGANAGWLRNATVLANVSAGNNSGASLRPIAPCLGVGTEKVPD